MKIGIPFSRWLGCALFCAALFTFGSLAYAIGDDEFVAFDGISRQGPPRLQLTAASSNEFDLDFSLPGLIRSLVDTRGGQFTRLTVEDAGIWGEVGSLELPAIRRLISIPYGSQPQLQIVDIETQTFSFAELGITAPILPVQASIEKIPGAWENAPFDWNRQLYEMDQFQVSSPIELGQVGILRGYRFTELVLYPVDVNPARQEVKVLLSARLKILLPGADMEETRAKRARYSSLPFEILTDRLMMKTSLDAGILEINGMPEPPLLLIITDPTWQSNTDLLNYISWKYSKGFRPVLVTTSTTGTTKELIKAYIQTAYNDWPIPPTFVLFIGDSGPIPAWTGSGSGNPKTDLNYSLLEGSDYMPDIDLGRWSIADLTDITNIITKSTGYEQNTISGTRNWQKKAVFMASEDNYPVSEGTHNYVITNYLTPDGYTCDRLYCHTYNATTQQVRTAHNDGRSLSIYSGHGSETYWGDGPPFYQSDVNGLTNTVFPFVQSYSCLTGNFTYSVECFMETWIRDDHAAVGAMGSTVTSYWT
ncbi:MAG: C25 family cysteine peptidase, partial [bacterium]